MKCSGRHGILVIGLLVTGCGAVAQCPTSATPRQIRNIALEQLVARSRATSDASQIHYASVADFLARNPDCCSVKGMPANAATGRVSNVELTILYRRQSDGAEPYFQQKVTFGHCLENMDETGRPLSEELYKLFLSHRHGEVVR